MCPTFSRSLCLPPDADALLGCRSPRVIALRFAQKDVFELVHPRIGKENRRIVLRNNGRRGDNRMSLRFKIF